MNKTKLTFIKFGVFFGVIALLVAKAYDIGIHRPPLKYAHISTFTQEYVRDLHRNAKDQGITIKAKGPFDWNNKKDLGQNGNNNWRHEEDENFVIYYQHDNNAIWQAYAQEVLRHANENIDYLKDLLGVYFYAADMNGRRLAIYLPNNIESYQKTVATLMNQPSFKADGVQGITITEIGPLGCLTKGIVINPQCFKVEPSHINGFVKVLQHEMCHYVFFSALDYSKDIKHYLWVSEGIAEYFCDRHDHWQVHTQDSIDFIQKNCQLNQEFPHEGNAAYWAGESFFRFIEKKGKKAAVKQFVQDAFSHTTDSIFIIRKQVPDQVHQQWVESLSKNMENNS